MVTDRNGQIFHDQKYLGDIVKGKEADGRVGESNFLEQQSETACPVVHITSFKGNPSDPLSVQESEQCSLAHLYTLYYTRTKIGDSLSCPAHQLFTSDLLSVHLQNIAFFYAGSYTLDFFG